MLETIQLAHIELRLYATLYTGVQNAEYLRSQLLAGNAEYEYAFINASMILSRKHVLAAVFRAMNDYFSDRLKSRNIHSEIVFALSPNNNIGEAFRRFGISDLTTNLLVFKVATGPIVTLESVQTHLTDAIKGNAVSFNDDNIRELSDLAQIRKVYKLSSAAALKKKKDPTQLLNGESSGAVDDERKEVEMQVLGVMALRGAA